MSRTGGPNLIGIGLAMLLVACGSDKPTKATGDAYDPVLVPAEFRSDFTNPLFPLEPGTTFVYEGRGDEANERNEVEVTSDTKVILGITCRVVHDRVWVDGELAEDTLDWFAQHQNGDVWYMGEDSREIEDGRVVSTEGSWEAGVDGAKPGIIMQGAPQVGQTYRQEYYKGEAEDIGQVISLDGAITTPAGAYQGCLKTREFSPLEPGHVEFKFYAPGVGTVAETDEAGDPVLVLVEFRSR